MDVDYGFRSKFFLDPLFQIHRVLVGDIQSHISRHPHVHLDGVDISHLTGTQVMQI